MFRLCKNQTIQKIDTMFYQVPFKAYANNTNCTKNDNYYNWNNYSIFL